jgi:hypothetical protein
MKTKDETLDMLKRWYPEISDILEKYLLIMVPPAEPQQPPAERSERPIP